MTTTKTGKGKYGTRESVMVRVVDSEKLSKVAQKVFALQYGIALKDVPYRVEPLVVVRNAAITNKWDLRENREVCVVCTEGVGWECDEYGLVTVPMTTPMGASAHVKLSGTVVAKCLTDEEVDLADWVRVFGDRLETNFDVWRDMAVNGRTPKWSA